MKYEDDGKEILATYPEVKEAIYYVEKILDTTNVVHETLKINSWGMLKKFCDTPIKVIYNIILIVEDEKYKYQDTRMSQIELVLSQLNHPQFLEFITNKMKSSQVLSA